MSRLWPDQVGIALFADRLLLARTSSGWRRRLNQKETVVLAPAQPEAPLWQAAIDALASKVAAGGMAGAKVSIVLSNCFMHYALVPWNAALGSEDEEIAFARHCFARVYGAEAETWVLKLSSKHAGKSRIACAVDTALIDALDNVMQPLGNRYCSLQPHLVASFNRWCARLGEKPCWFVAAESGLLCLALLADGEWRSVRTIKVSADWCNELPATLNRETCLVEAKTECNDVYVVSADVLNPSAINSGQWKIKNLVLALLPGMTGADAAYSIALGA